MSLDKYGNDAGGGMMLCKGIQPLLISDEICPKREFCWRYKSQPKKDKQSYFMGMPYDGREKSCEYFLDNDDYGQDRKTKYF